MFIKYVSVNIPNTKPHTPSYNNSLITVVKHEAQYHFLSQHYSVRLELPSSIRFLNDKETSLSGITRKLMATTDMVLFLSFDHVKRLVARACFTVFIRR